MSRGIVRSFDAEQGVGLIAQDDGPAEIEARNADIEYGAESLAEGLKVEFDVVEREQVLRAANIKVL
jgi:cold shock protein